jgi:hypothetical protein
VPVVELLSSVSARAPASGSTSVVEDEVSESTGEGVRKSRGEGTGSRERERGFT